jgi:hypothetical protein
MAVSDHGDQGATGDSSALTGPLSEALVTKTFSA